jgi:flagellar hook-associated protein 2
MLSSIMSFSGLASGVQWRDSLDMIFKAETARRVTPLEREASLEQKRIDALSTYKGLVDKLAAAAKPLQDGSAFGKFAVSVTDSPATGHTLLAASASATASAGKYSVEVASLARAETWASGSKTSDTAALGLPTDPTTGTASFEINGKKIVVDGSDSLNSIRDKINAAGAGVTASVVRVADGDYRLTMTSDTMGSAGITYVDGPEGAGTALGLAETLAGTDAVVNVNGVKVTRQTNSISDAITGVTLDLKKAEPGSVVELTVEKDTQAAVDAVRAFADAYNAVRTFVDGQRDSSTAPLSRSSLLRHSLSAFKGVVLSDATDPAAGTLNNLALAGVTLTREGMLEVDETKFKETLAAKQVETKALFADVGARMDTETARTTRAETGLIASQTKIHDATILRLNQRADEARVRVDRMIERMVQEFVRMEQAMGMIQAQGNWLASQVASLPKPPE